MFWTILALIFLVALGGFVSYYGDLQGRRWGKRRVSWFGMRPKHTAILITSLSGSVIALVSVAAVLIAAPKVRAVVLQGERAINENRAIHDARQGRPARPGVDPFTSAVEGAPVRPPHTWLLRLGWRRARGAPMWDRRVPL